MKAAAVAHVLIGIVFLAIAAMILRAFDNATDALEQEIVVSKSASAAAPTPPTWAAAPLFAAPANPTAGRDRSGTIICQPIVGPKLGARPTPREIV